MIKELFKLDFKKPEITDSIQKVLNRKESLEKKLDALYSRLETVEICNSNSKFSDSKLLENALFLDSIQFISEFENNNPASFSDKFDSISKDNSINQKFNEIYSQLIKNSDSENDTVLIEEKFSELIQLMEKYVFKKNKSLFENDIDKFKNKIRIQSIFGIAILTFLTYAGFKYYQKVKPIKPDQARMYYMAEETETPTKAKMITAEVKPGESWEEISFVLPEPTQVKNVKFEPVSQIFARIQFKEVRYLDEKKEVIQTKSLQLTELGMVDNKENDEICCAEGLKAGKLIPKKYLEFESINSLPSFFIKQKPILKVKEIVLVYRYIKNSQKFTD